MIHKKGRPTERFFRRKPKNMLSNPIEREVDWKTMLEERQKEQTKLATKKGKKSAEKLTAGDEVKMQETTNKKTMARNGRDKRTKSIR